MAEKEGVCLGSMRRGGRGWWSGGNGRVGTRVNALVHRLWSAAGCGNSVLAGVCVCVRARGGRPSQVASLGMSRCPCCVPRNARCGWMMAPLDSRLPLSKPNTEMVVHAAQIEMHAEV